MKFTNRKIKFRVWTGATMEYKVLAGALGHFYVEGMSKTDSACLSDANTIYSDAAPLMQWTGLVDKNGVEIYEGDILGGDFSKNGPVYFSETTSSFRTKDYFFDSFGLNRQDQNHYTLSASKFIIIGNIFENPELLAAP